ncbi:MAG: DUF3267 domain-containing protein [Bacteroidales bacterium]|nr:DUF3267 domain-containing protein [Bacteroidales bacterium]
MSKKHDKKPEEIPCLEGYQAEKRTISIVAANLWAIGVALALVMIGMLLLLLCYPVGDGTMWLFGSSMLLLACLIAIVVHELIHGLTWMAVTHSSFKHLTFGLMSGAVYCHIDVPMTKRAYCCGALMPLLLLGVVPYIVSLIVGNLWVMLFGATMIGAAMGDVLIVWAIRKESPDTMVYDHPSEPGCLLYHLQAE